MRKAATRRRCAAPPALIAASAFALMASTVAAKAPPAAVVGVSFEGVSEAQLRRELVPPDTMGAIGTNQFMETTNGAFAVYDKKTMKLEKFIKNGDFWRAAGQTGAGGDARVMFYVRTGQWIVVSIGADNSNIQIAVSKDADAKGPWKSALFTGFKGGVADFPTLAMDSKAIYIGTKDFTGGIYQGATLNVIARNDLFGAGAPKLASLKQFFTPAKEDRGYIIQGVNQLGNQDVGKIIAVGHNAKYPDRTLLRYDVKNPGTKGATETAAKAVAGVSRYQENRRARQPDMSRVIDTSDDRIAASAWEQNNKIYAVHTVTPVGSEYTAVEWTVVDAKTGKLIQQGTISGDNFDYYQGSLAVNASGQVVIAFNRSGEKKGDGVISFFADAFNSNKDGALVMTAKNLLLHASPIGNYHRGNKKAPPDDTPWGDYSAVSLDPSNPQSFWAVGEFADEQTGGGTNRWATWISQITLAAVPEPETWAMLLVGFALVGAATRRRAGSKTLHAGRRPA